MQLVLLAAAAAAAALVSHSEGLRPRPPPPPPQPPGPHFNYGGLRLELAHGALTASVLNVSAKQGGADSGPPPPLPPPSARLPPPPAPPPNHNYNFVGGPAGTVPKQGCHMLGDVVLRVARAGTATGAAAQAWAIYDSAQAAPAAWATITNATAPGPGVLAAHDITGVLNASATDKPGHVSRLPTGAHTPRHS